LWGKDLRSIGRGAFFLPITRVSFPPFLHAPHFLISSEMSQILSLARPSALAGEFARAPTLGSEAVKLAALVPMIGGEHPATMAASASY
jgi:hypothetical protein